MRRLLIIITILFTLPALAAKPVTTEQLEQFLVSAHGKIDAEVARQIAELRLTERLSPVRLIEMQSQLPGDKSRQALLALGDESAFLSPPASEFAEMAAPDLPEQRRIMGLVVAYVRKTIPQLPNFLATRATTRFEDRPQRKADFVSKYEPLHPVALSRAQVSYQDGHEFLDTGAKSAKDHAPERGLTTWGEFGPILTTVLLDAARSKLAWLRWEQGESGPLAVFTYAVPREGSHYEVDYCCVPDSEGRAHIFHELEAYHGEISVDSATGAILRLKIQAEVKAGQPVSRADLLVEYAKVEIGGESYICPVRSIAVSRARSLGQEVVEMVQASPHGAGGATLAPVLVGATADVTEQTLLNDASYSQYHIFRAESRVLTGTANDLPTLGAAPGENTAPEAYTAPTAPPASGSATADLAPAAPTGTAPAPALVTSFSAISAPIAAAPEPEPIPEISIEPATSLPDIPSAPQGPATHTGFTIRTTSRLVDLGVVAYDKKGHPVTDLKQGDFEIYDNGRKQEVRYFSQASTQDAEVSAPTILPSSAPDQSVFANRRAVAASPKLAAGEPKISATILLIDSSNLAWGDLTYAREEMLRFLQSLPVNDRVGLYITKASGFRILEEATPDHTSITALLRQWMPSAQDLSNAQDEERRNRQQMEWVHSIGDLKYVNGNSADAPDKVDSRDFSSALPPDAQLRENGSDPGRRALSILVGVAHHLAALPGHKNLVWVSSDNVLADWSDKSVSIDKGSKFIDAPALRVQETMNDAHVAVYPLDASQLEAGGISADIGTRNVLAIGRSDRDKATEILGDAAPGMKPGRITAQMQQDIRPIQGTYRELADATGGRIFRRSGNIATELNSVVDDGRAAYLLSFTPDQQADDKYHLLTVKPTGRLKITLRYPTGYQFNKEPSTLKDRFRQAVWQPGDASEIALIANTVAAAKGATLKLNIATTDLDLAQQGALWTGKLDIFLIEKDDNAMRAHVTGQTLVLRLKPVTYQKLLLDGIPFDQFVQPRPDTGSVRILVVDENSGRIGSVTIPTSALARRY